MRKIETDDNISVFDETFNASIFQTKFKESLKFMDTVKFICFQSLLF